METMTDEYLRKPKASHIAVRRARGPESHTAADRPITFDPVFVGPQNCDGCDPGLTVVIDGQVFVADLQDVTRKTATTTYPTGVA